MFLRCRRTPVVFLLALFAVLGIAESSAALTIDVTEYAVTVSNATPNGGVVLLSCVRGSRGGRTHVERRVVMLRDDDGDGTVQLTPDGPVPLRSVWVAVDFSSSATAAGAHPDFPLHVTEIVASSFRKDASGAIVQLERENRRLILFLVRPGKGAWLLFARDGADGDSDRSENARVTLDFASARAVEGKDAAPKTLKADDVVVAIDPGHLDVYLARIAK